MSGKLILFLIIHLGAFVYFIEMLRRTAIKAREYQMRETRSSLPLGFIRLRHIVVLYVFFYIVWIAASIVLYFYYIDGANLG